MKFADVTYYFIEVSEMNFGAYHSFPTCILSRMCIQGYFKMQKKKLNSCIIEFYL